MPNLKYELMLPI